MSAWSAYVDALLAVLACALGPLKHADLADLVRRIFGLEIILTAHTLRISSAPRRAMSPGGGKQSGG